MGYLTLEINLSSNFDKIETKKKKSKIVSKTEKAREFFPQSWLELHGMSDYINALTWSGCPYSSSSI